MGIVGIILLVAFVIICLLLVGLVLLQNEEGEGLGGLFGGSGGGSAAFGSRSASVLTKVTYVLVTLFFITSLGLALLNKAPTEKQLVPAAQQTEAGSSQWWQDNATEAPEANAPAAGVEQ